MNVRTPLATLGVRACARACIGFCKHRKVFWTPFPAYVVSLNLNIFERWSPKRAPNSVRPANLRWLRDRPRDTLGNLQGGSWELLGGFLDVLGKLLEAFGSSPGGGGGDDLGGLREIPGGTWERLLEWKAPWNFLVTPTRHWEAFGKLLGDAVKAPGGSVMD